MGRFFIKYREEIHTNFSCCGIRHRRNMDKPVFLFCLRDNTCCVDLVVYSAIGYKACDFLDTDLVNYDNNTKTFGSPTTLKSFVIGVNIGF